MLVCIQKIKCRIQNRGSKHGREMGNDREE